jgi:hypothetical protein
MNDAEPKKTKPISKRGPTAAKQAASLLPGDYTSIRVPAPPPSAFNKNRPAGLSSLV